MKIGRNIFLYCFRGHVVTPKQVAPAVETSGIALCLKFFHHDKKKKNQVETLKNQWKIMNK